MPEPVTTAAAISGGFNVAGGLFGSLFQKRNIRLQKEAQMQLADYTYQKDLEQWNRANQYNTPTEQMSRYQDAGLNPRIMYGQGTGANAGNTATSLPKYQQPKVGLNTRSPFDTIGGAMAQYQDYKLRAAQIDNVNVQNKNVELKNNLLSGEISYRIEEAKQKAAKAGDSASLESIRRLEAEWRWINKVSTRKFSAELLKSQGDAMTSVHRSIEAEQYAKWAKQGLNKSDPLWMRQLQNKGVDVRNWFRDNPYIQQFRNVGMPSNNK